MSKARKPHKARRTWQIKPVERVVDSKKRYDRKKKDGRNDG